MTKPNCNTPESKLLPVVEALSREVETLKTKAISPFGVPYVTTGRLGEQGYSILKAAGLSMGALSPDQAKEEHQISLKLKALYGKNGYIGTANSIMVPFSSEHIPTFEPDGQKLAAEIRQKSLAATSGYDVDEMRWHNKRSGGLYTKALGTLDDTAGGVLVGFPTLGELIDLQRNMEVFTRAGASELTLPPNARFQYPKLQGGSTAYWVGENAAITESQQVTGSLDLQGKKLGILVKLNNELFRYVSPSAESMVRLDMARVGALRADLAMLEGTGGTQIKGLITYPTQSSWTGVDRLLTYTVTNNTFQPEDVYNMLGRLPDPVQAMEKTFVMRNDLWGRVRGRRADAVSANDAKGPFVFNITRSVTDRIDWELDGYPVVGSSQVSATRGSGSQTYVLAGAFADWVVGRFGTMEFLSSNQGDTSFTNDQTWLRGIQILDAGPRNLASFIFADAITIQ